MTGYKACVYVRKKERVTDCYVEVRSVYKCVVCVCIHPSISPVVGWGGGEMFYRSVTVPVVCWKDLGFPGDLVGQTTLEAAVSVQLNPNPYKSHHLCPGFQTVSQGCVCNQPELDFSKHLNACVFESKWNRNDWEWSSSRALKHLFFWTSNRSNENHFLSFSASHTHSHSSWKFCVISKFSISGGKS